MNKRYSFRSRVWKLEKAGVLTLLFGAYTAICLGANRNAQDACVLLLVDTAIGIAYAQELPEIAQPKSTADRNVKITDPALLSSFMAGVVDPAALVSFCAPLPSAHPRVDPG